MTLPDLALRFILGNPDVTTVIPGMRRVGHVERNLAASDGHGWMARRWRACAGIAGTRPAGVP